MRIIFPILFVILAPLCQASGPTLRQVYLDQDKRVHVVTAAGKDLQMLDAVFGVRPSLAPNRKVAAWLLHDDFVGEKSVEEGASTLVVYSNGKTRKIECPQLIRRYWYWKRGEQVGVDCGGRHFAGTETLYDSSTIKVVDSFEQDSVPLKSRPAWSLHSPALENPQ